MKGLYVHLPFCKNRCAYCGFYSETESFDLQSDYFRALVSDLRSRDKRRYETLYVGGGTPSSVDRKMLAAFLDIISVLNIGWYKETTIEANPESIDDEFCELLSTYKFTRTSIGCQSTSDDVLAKLTRIHNAKDVFCSVELVKKTAPETDINLDLIYDIPDVDYSVTLQSMKDIISLEPDHISAYTYSNDNNFIHEREDDTDFMRVKDFLEDAGYIKYEISNFAKPGHESKHNINYWKLGDYDGIGASAWSLENNNDKRTLKGKTSDIKNYIKTPTSFCEVQTTESPDTIIESIVFGLRMTEGIDIENKCSTIDEKLKRKIYNCLEKLVEKELLEWNGSRVCLSRQGELLLDSVQLSLWEQLT